MSYLRYPPYESRWTFMDQLLTNPSQFTWTDVVVSGTGVFTLVNASSVDQIAFVLCKAYTPLNTSVTGSLPGGLVSYVLSGNRYMTQFGNLNPFSRAASNTSSEVRGSGYVSIDNVISIGCKNYFITPVPANHSLEFRGSPVTSMTFSVATRPTREPILYLANGIVSSTIVPNTIATANFSTIADVTNYPILNWSNITSFSEINTTKYTTLNINNTFSWHNVTRSGGTANVNIANNETIFHPVKGSVSIEISRPIINGVQIYADSITGLHIDDYFT